jgi:hypothetical protein
VFSHKSVVNIIVLGVLGLIGVFCVAFSYVTKIDGFYGFRVAGSASLTMCLVGIALLVVKKRNK